MSNAIDKIIEDLDFATNRIGEQTRTIAIGVLAIAWLFLAGGQNAPAVKVAPNVSVLLVAGALAIASLLTDYFQYLCAYFSSANLLKGVESAVAAPEYDYESLLYRGRILFFWAKQVTCLVGTTVLVYAIVRALIP